MKMPTESSVGDLVKIGHSHFNRIGNEISDRIFYWQLWCIFDGIYDEIFHQQIRI